MQPYVALAYYCGLHINLQPPHPALELETGIYIVFGYGTSILGQKYRDFEDCSSLRGKKGFEFMSRVGCCCKLICKPQ